MEATTVASMARQVADNLRTEYQSKKHGGYAIYRDERVIVGLDTFVPNVSVRLVDGSEFGRCVFSAAYHSYDRPEVYRPGQWTDYLAGLFEKAKEVKEKREAVRAAERQLDHERRFAPVDDSALFASAKD